ncbi:MAG: hypothetical protein F9K23_09460 [Bacteroidetes bacterium]|nr:MAG: hypothetical protein F9K23_09460 [Bacteroidota bacterium]
MFLNGKKELPLLLLMLVFRLSLLGQSVLAPEHIEVSPTRVGNNLRVLFEDSRGFIWAGTMSGLVRYDGFSVKYYEYTPDDREGELDMGVVTGDNKGNIWGIASTHGLLVLPFGERGFGELRKPGFDNDFPKPKNITFDKGGNIWGVTLQNELFFVDMSDTSVTVWPTKKTGAVENVFIDERQRLWLYNHNTVFCVDKPSLTMNFENKQGITSGIISAVHDGKNLFVFTQQTLYKAHFSNNYLHINQLYELDKLDNQGKKEFFRFSAVRSDMPLVVMATTGRMLLFVDKESGKLEEPIIEGVNTSKYDANNYLITKGNVVYIATNKGFLRTSISSKAFTAYTDDLRPKLRCVAPLGPDTLLVGTFAQGIFVYTKKNDGRWQKNKQWVLGNPTFMSVNTLNRFYYDKNNRLWAATNGGLFLYNGKTWSSKYPSTSVWGIVQGNGNDFWMGTNRAGLIKFNSETGATKSYFPNGSSIPTDNHNRIWQTQTYKNKIYVGTSAGMFEFDTATERFTPVFSEQLKSIPVWDFFISDSLWLLPTQGRGLWKFLPKTGELTNVDSINNFLYSLLKDAAGDFWFVNDKGLIKYDVKQGKSANYSAFDGLNTNFLSYTGITRLNDAQIAVCGEDGFTVVDAAPAKQNVPKHSLFVPSFKYAGVQVADYLESGSEITVDYNKGQLLLEWAATHLFGHNRQLVYKLEGEDADWNISSTGNSITYTNLEPGSYVFKAYLVGQANESNSELYRLRIVISPPFWLTWWFKSVVALVVVGLSVYLIYGWVVRQRLKQAKLKSEIDALRAQMNPHFIFNALNSIQAFIYTENKLQANEYLVKFAKLMRLILQNSRQELISVLQEQQFLNLYIEMEALRFEGRFTYNVIVDKGSEGYKIPSMLLQPLVENALKHGTQAGGDPLHVEVHFFERNKELVCEVTDNGRGFAADYQNDSPKASLGLTLVQERLDTLSKLYGKKYDIVAGNKEDYGLTGKGAFVSVLIPQHDKNTIS